MKTITIPVEVPADLEVGPSEYMPALNKVGVPGCYWHFPPKREGVAHDWHGQVCQQIAAAVEARKPRPPKFAVGDVVEYVNLKRSGTVTAVHAPKDGSQPAYFLNEQGYSVFEDGLTLVRRAAK